MVENIQNVYTTPHQTHICIHKLIHISFIEQTQKSGCYEMINNGSNKLHFHDVYVIRALSLSDIDARI